MFSRPDGDQNLTGLKLSLPAGATGSLAAAPQCPLADAQAGTCDEKYRIGTIRNTVGVGDSLLTVPGELYLSEAMQPGDAASIAVRVPAKVGPIDLGQVVLMNRIFLRESDNGLEVVSTDDPDDPRRRAAADPQGRDPGRSPGLLPQPDRMRAAHPDRDLLRRPGRRVVLEHRARRRPVQRAAVRSRHCAWSQAAAGQTDQFDHPPFQAIVTQDAGEADITNARVVLPAILRPNVPFFNEPGALCNDFQAATDTCPAKSTRRQRARLLTAAAVPASPGRSTSSRRSGTCCPRSTCTCAARPGSRCC